MTRPLPTPVQAQQPALSEVPVLSSDLEVVKTHQPEASETVAPVTEQSATMNVCELCICESGAPACTGLGPKQSPHRVPVPEPSTYSGPFTV